MLSCLKNVIILAQNNLTNEAKIQKKWPKPTFYNFEKKKKSLELHWQALLWVTSSQQIKIVMASSWMRTAE